MRRVGFEWAALLGVAFVSSVIAAAALPSTTSLDSARVVALGHRLFFDPMLSPDGSIECSGCHQPAHAFTDGRTISIGVDHVAGTRNTPSLLDVFDGTPLFWDGRRDRLEIAVLDPLINRVEMGNSDLASVLVRLQASPDYRRAFAKAFHEGDRSVSTSDLGKALAAYIDSLPRPSNSYDRLVAGQNSALSPMAREGLRVFTGKAECSSCHDPAGGRFTDGKFHQSGVGLGDAQTHLGALTEAALRQNLKIADLGSAIGSNTQLAALGRFLVSHRASDVGAFRTPSLRNVELTAPYMHDGSIKTLDEAVDREIYYRGLATGHPIALTAQERLDLLAFLQSLTASEFNNPPRQVHQASPPRSSHGY